MRAFVTQFGASRGRPGGVAYTTLCQRSLLRLQYCVYAGSEIADMTVFYALKIMLLLQMLLSLPRKSASSTTCCSALRSCSAVASGLRGHTAG